MKKILNKYKLCISYSIIIFIMLLLVSLLNLLGINTNITYYINIIIMIILFIILGYIKCYNNPNKAIVVGLKYSLIYIIPLLIASIILNIFTYKTIIYYLVLIISCIIGSILSKNKKTT